MEHNKSYTRITSCYPEVIEALCVQIHQLKSQICELKDQKSQMRIEYEYAISQMRIELEDTCNQLALSDYRCQQAQYQRDELLYLDNYYPNNGCEPDED